MGGVTGSSKKTFVRKRAKSMSDSEDSEDSNPKLQKAGRRGTGQSTNNLEPSRTDTPTPFRRQRTKGKVTDNMIIGSPSSLKKRSSNSMRTKKRMNSTKTKVLAQSALESFERKRSLMEVEISDLTEENLQKH